MSEFQNGEIFQLDGMHQASTMYLADAGELGRFDSRRLQILEKEWKAVYDQLPTNDDEFSFKKARRIYEGKNGELTFMYSPQYNSFVLLGFELKPSARGHANIVPIETALSRRKTFCVAYGDEDLAAACTTGAGTALAVVSEAVDPDGTTVRTRERLVICALVDHFRQRTAAIEAYTMENYRILVSDFADDLGHEVLQSQDRVFETFDDHARKLQSYEFKLKRNRRATLGIMALAAAAVGLPLILDVKINMEAVQAGLCVVFGTSALAMGIIVVRNSVKVQSAWAAIRSGHALKIFYDFVASVPRIT